MIRIDDLFHRAIAHHSSGELPAAEQLYREILRVDANHSDALHLLGVIALQVGQYATALELLSRAIELDGARAEFHSNLGLVHQALEDLTAADQCHREAVELEKDFAQGWQNLGNVLWQQRRWDEAAAASERALALRPGYAEAINTLGNIARDRGRLDEAAVLFQQALEFRPNFGEALANLGAVLQEQGRAAEAVEMLERAVAMLPHVAAVHNNLGNALRDLKRVDEAIASYRRALALDPNFAEAHNGLGMALADQGSLAAAQVSFARALELRPNYAEALTNVANLAVRTGDNERAIATYRRALELRPDLVKAWLNLGAAVQEQGDVEEARALFRHAIELDPLSAEAHWNLGLVELLLGEYASGWEEFAWHKRMPDLYGERRSFHQPLWEGAALAGQTILLHAEQGFGDTLEFIRYAPLVSERGARVIVEGPPQLVRLLRSCRGVAEVVARGAALPHFDVQVPLLDLPRIFGTTLETIPAEVPYLCADADLVARWNEEFAGVRDFKIGIAWSGDPRNQHNRARSFSLQCFEPLAQMRGVRLYSLQQGAGREELSAVGAPSVVDLAERIGDFADTAAVMAHLDLVICCDSAPAHLAGALGRPVWVPLALVPAWRYLLARDDNPWYPTMRVFRQDRTRDWSKVFEQIAQVLAARL